jgi:hypothetical protein
MNQHEEQQAIRYPDIHYVDELGPIITQVDNNNDLSSDAVINSGIVKRSIDDDDDDAPYGYNVDEGTVLCITGF